MCLFNILFILLLYHVILIPKLIPRWQGSDGEGRPYDGSEAACGGGGVRVGGNDGMLDHDVDEGDDDNEGGDVQVLMEGIQDTEATTGAKQSYLATPRVGGAKRVRRGGGGGGQVEKRY